MSVLLLKRLMFKMMTQLQCGRFKLDLSAPKIMGVLNCTPDSFSDGGRFLAPDLALAQAEKMIAAGVDIIDVGAESTRPYAQAVAPSEEIARLTPVVRELVQAATVPISIDTKNPMTMRAMLDLGVDMINDVAGFTADGALEAVADSNCALCIMHMRGQPETMQDNTQYSDVVEEVAQFLQTRVAAAKAVGICDERIVLDPGFGFGKNPAQNMALVFYAQRFALSRFPVLLGVSRKSTVGHYLDDAPVENRLIGSVVLAALSAWQGANILRVHDVHETKEALKMVVALKSSQNGLF